MMYKQKYLTATGAVGKRSQATGVEDLDKAPEDETSLFPLLGQTNECFREKALSSVYGAVSRRRVGGGEKSVGRNPHK